MLRSSNSHGRHFTESATSIIPVKLAYSDFFLASVYLYSFPLGVGWDTCHLRGQRVTILGFTSYFQGEN